MCVVTSLLSSNFYFQWSCYSKLSRILKGNGTLVCYEIFPWLLCCILSSFLVCSACRSLLWRPHRKAWGIWHKAGDRVYALPPWKDLCSACLNEQCVWNRFLSEFSSCGSMNLLAVSWSINLEHLVRVASCNTFDYSSTDSYSSILQNGVVRVASSIN